MYILGINGSPTLCSEESAALGWPFDIFHDASAVLLKDGHVVAGVAQERLDRIKQSNAFPIEAVKFCLSYAGINLSDISHIAYPLDESVLNSLIASNIRNVIRDKCLPLSVAGGNGRAVFAGLLQEAFQEEVSPDRLVFVQHHHAHAMSAFAHSGFEESLVYVRDGWGDDISGIVAIGTIDGLEQLHEMPMLQSLGHFYLTGTQLLGYRLGDEYKVMGLAPFGEAARYRAEIERFVSRTSDGINLDLKGLWTAFASDPQFLRDRSAPFEQQHKDLAAAIQETLEDLVFHELKYWKEKTGQKNICFAGGVAQNCSLNGKIFKRRMFTNMFVPAAPGDGGLSLGAALCVHHTKTPKTHDRKPRRIRSVSWGSDLSDTDKVKKGLIAWNEILSFEEVSDIESKTAHALANGKVIGWARGRSEFGPRALGNRSILADPRPKENQTRINEIVKERELFRPFAPSVADEAVTKFFELDAHDGEFAFMTFVVMVREQYRSLLGAITHVDGSARIQAVSKATNPSYWTLISEFGRITNIPILLNTSFNNNAEPIVETVEDTIACFLTTDLDHLVIGDYWVEKKISGPEICTQLRPALLIGYVLENSNDPKHGRRFFIKSNKRYSRRTEIDEGTFETLISSTPWAQLDRASTECFYDLWRRRFIRMHPPDPECS